MERLRLVISAWRTAVESATGNDDSRSCWTSNDGYAKCNFGLSVIPFEGKVRCGTPGYMPPEVYCCEGADIRSDIYSFGLVLWQMATGSRIPPFWVEWGGNMNVFLRQIYEKQMVGNFPLIENLMKEQIYRCLRPNPKERYANFTELRLSLENIWLKTTGAKFNLLQAGTKSAGQWSNKGLSLSKLSRHGEAAGCFEKALGASGIGGG